MGEWRRDRGGDGSETDQWRKEKEIKNRGPERIDASLTTDIIIIKGQRREQQQYNAIKSDYSCVCGYMRFRKNCETPMQKVVPVVGYCSV